MKKKAETKRILIHSADTDDRIFQEAVSAFHIHDSSIQEYTSDKRTLRIIEALISGIRIE